MQVGLMRRGLILAESKPAELISQYNVKTLEDVFFHLCRNDKTDSYARKGRYHTKISASLTDNKDFEPNKPGCMDYYRPPSIRRIGAMTIKNFLRMWRTLILLVFQYLSPAIQVCIFCLAIGSDPQHVNVAVLNKDLILGVRYLDTLKEEKIHQIKVDSAKEGEDLVLNGNAWALLSIGENFTTALSERMICPVNLSEESAKSGSIHVRLDYSDKMMAEYLQRNFLHGFEVLLHELEEEMGLPEQTTVVPFLYDKPIYGSSTSPFLDYMACGLVLSLVFFLALGLTSMSFVIDKKEGLLDRCTVAGVTSFEIMCGHIVTQFGVMATQVCIILLLVIEVFNVENRGNIFLIILLALMQGMCGMTYGFLISCICNEESSAMMLAVGSFYPLLLLSGTIWPIESMPTALQHFSTGLPQTLAMKSMRWILSRGRGLTWRPVYIGYLVTCGWTMFFILNILVYTYCIFSN
uniref:ABC transmembrane type-2 domain-containing protein n=1 Tax=Strigamia maritima TaxID=126957 RepID=T1IGU0_STRMM